MGEHEQVGDDVNVDCPWCGVEQSIQDHVSDGLDEGFEFECEDCQKMIEVTGVDYSVTVTVDRPKIRPADGSPGYDHAAGYHD